MSSFSHVLQPAASPITDVQGDAAKDEFATRLLASGQRLTQDRFVATLKERGWQYVGADALGDQQARPGPKPVRSTNAVTTRAGSWRAAWPPAIRNL